MRRIFPHLVLGLGAALMLLPFYWMILTSIRAPAEIFDPAYRARKAENRVSGKLNHHHRR